MIFRRIKAHIQKENWFAVGIDFFIVVVGVFIGIQVANWNATQFERREEAAIVERLKADFDRIKRESDRSLAFHIKLTEDVRTALRSLRSGVLKDDDIPEFERALLLGPIFQTSADRAGTFTELMSSGRGNILRDRDLLHALVDYEDFLERFAFANTYLIENTLLATRDFKAAFEYDTEFRVTEYVLTLKEDGERFVSYDFNALAVDPDFENAMEELLFVQTTYTLWRTRISERVDDIRQKIIESGT